MLTMSAALPELIYKLSGNSKPEVHLSPLIDHTIILGSHYAIARFYSTYQMTTLFWLI